MAAWTADIVNDPEHDYDLRVELSRDGDVLAMIERDDAGTLVLRCFQNETTLDIPATWLSDMIRRAETELPRRG